jgi:hypothetical protein
MEAHIRKTKPAVITDRNYFANLLQLIPKALNLLLGKAHQLKDGFRGIQATRFCIIIIGTIQRVAPPIVRKRLMNNPTRLLSHGKQTDRTTDASDTVWCNNKNPDTGLGMTYFIDSTGHRRAEIATMPFGMRDWIAREAMNFALLCKQLEPPVAQTSVPAPKI